MLVACDIKLIRRDQKQRGNCEACLASPTCFWSSLINLISKDTALVFCLSCNIRRFKGVRRLKKIKKIQFCSNLLTSRMRYGPLVGDVI